MQQINRGQRVKLGDIVRGGNRFNIVVSAVGTGLNLDFACFGLDAAGKLSDDRYMTFFNQPVSPCSGVAVTDGNLFAFDLDRIPASIDRLVLTAAIDGAGAMGKLSNSSLTIKEAGQDVGRFEFTGSDFQDERALMLFEMYRKDGIWRVSATAQGFNGGLDALVRHFGGDVSDSAAPASAVQAPTVKPSGPDLTKRINLEKRIAQEAPQLVDLTKKATISLEKVGLSTHRAKVCLILDISISMEWLYDAGKVQAFAERIFALATRFDDDGDIDIFLFGIHVHKPAGMTLANFTTYIRNVLRQHPLEGGTNYGRAFKAVRDHYFPAGTPAGPAALPVYAMFLTDGDTQDKDLARREIMAASHQGIFWQVMAIGRGRPAGVKKAKASTGSGWFSRPTASAPAAAVSEFPFLDELDDMPGRFIDNVDFFCVSSPDQYTDDELYDLLMTEYPEWLKQAKAKGLIA
jgi:stress response protein SCP2